MLIICLITSCFSIPSYAYARLGGKLTGGIYNRTYYIGMSSSAYVDPTINAIADWNWAVNSSNNGSGVDFYFKRVSSNTNATLCFWAESQVTQSWAGLTRLFDASGNLMNNNGSYQYTNWKRASVIFNSAQVPVNNYTKMRTIAGHEIGHTIGLAHISDNGKLMYPYYDTCSAAAPTGDEVRGAQAIYK